jgi:hypothetical protein
LKTWNFNSVVAARNLLLNTNLAFDTARILRLVAWNTIFQMVAWEVHIAQYYHTQPTILSTGLLLTTVVARGVKTLTRLRTFENGMHAIRMTSCLTFVAAVNQASIARELASSFRAELLEVEWL